MKIKVLVYPFALNPYQWLLYNQMKDSVEITYLKGPTFSQTINNIGTRLFLPLLLVFYRIKGYKIFHLHWVYAFTFPGKKYLPLLFSTIYYYLILIFIKLCGYQIIWTVHNILPHKKIFINDIKARRFLSRIAAAKIVHSDSTLAEMKKYFINTDNIHLIPHGNYIGVYPNIISKQKARAKLKINKNDFVFLFFGRIEPYKGVENLLKVFSRLNHPKTKLVIAGKCTNPRLKKILSTYQSLPKLMIINQFIPDKDVQLYFNAADIAVYPFKKVTSSGSVMLALSFGKSVIYPNTGNLKDLPNNIGYTYELDEPNGLKKCLSKAIGKKENLQIMNSNAFTYAKKSSWDNIATETIRVYSGLINLK